MIQHSVSDALKEAAAKCVGQPATPEVCERIKFELVLIMRMRHGIDWTNHAHQLHVEFTEDGFPNLIAPPELLRPTLH